MVLKNIIYEDFVNYKKPSMFLIFPKCSFKCDKENGSALCQNSALTKEPDLNVDKEWVIKSYLNNPISEAIVCGGLEPMDSILDLLSFIDCLRHGHDCNDPIVIYTGYTEEELEKGEYGGYVSDLAKNYWENIKKYGNIIVKFGRYRPNNKPHYDEILGVQLISDN